MVASLLSLSLLSFFLLVLLIFLLILPSSNEKPILYKALNIDLEQYNFKNLKEKFGNNDIYISHSSSNGIDMDGDIKKTTLNAFCKIMNDEPDWYFKTEDEYDFLNIIGIKNNVIKKFDAIFDNYTNILKKDCSFWLGGKGSTTSWHTDIDDLSYLYVIEGKKKIQFISPKFNEKMYERKIFTNGSKWSEIDFKNIDYKKYPKFKDVKVECYILNAGDAIFIPKNWWHCVENLDETIGITYKIFRQEYMFSFIGKFFRKWYAKYNGYKMYDMNEIIQKKISKKDLIKMKELILKNKG